MKDHILQEILSQPGVWRRTLASLFGKDSPLKWLDPLIGEGPVLFTGMGSSYYLSIAAAPFWERRVNGRALVHSASDVLTYPELCGTRDAKGTVIGISRSGRTFETRDAVRFLRKERGWSTVGVTCHAGSALTKECDGSLVLAGAAEKSRFTTRALTTTLLALEALGAVRAGDTKLEAELKRLPDLADALLKLYAPRLEKLAATGRYERYAFLGQGPYHGLALELKLKTEEVVRAPAVACQTLEYLHGPKYAADASTLVTLLFSDGGKAYQEAAAAKVLALGAPAAIVCEEVSPKFMGRADIVIKLGSGLSDYARMLLVMPLMQFFIYRRAVAAGRSAWIRRMVYR